jgi:hypothetical protein
VYQDFTSGLSNGLSVMDITSNVPSSVLRADRSTTECVSETSVADDTVVAPVIAV